MARRVRNRASRSEHTGPRIKSNSEDGFLLMEVMVSALLVALIVIATFAGFEVANRSTADERAHAQADALAHQDEDRLRGMTISQLSSLSETHTAKANGTVFTITSSAKFIADATGTESCSAASTNADYIETTSEVGWPALKTRPKVVETGLIAPHVGGSLIAQVNNAGGKGVPGMTVTLTGPSPSAGVETGTTNASGCVIFGSVEPGEYDINASKTGYVEKDGNSEVPESQQLVSVTNGATTKKELQFDEAGEISVKFESAAAKVKGETFLVFNTSMTTPSFRAFGTIGTQSETLTTPKTLFPFSPAAYVVYAGSCLANNPTTNNAALTPPSLPLAAGAHGETTVSVPPIKISDKNGEKVAGKEGSGVEASGTLVDTTCEAEGITVKRTFKTKPSGELTLAEPYGTYTLCLAAVISGKTRVVTTTNIKNAAVAGVTVPTAYLGTGEIKASGCP
jgi:Tfp pilus assembly protein PilV